MVRQFHVRLSSHENFMHQVKSKKCTRSIWVICTRTFTYVNPSFKLHFPWTLFCRKGQAKKECSNSPLLLLHQKCICNTYTYTQVVYLNSPPRKKIFRQSALFHLLNMFCLQFFLCMGWLAILLSQVNKLSLEYQTFTCVDSSHL